MEPRCATRSPLNDVTQLWPSLKRQELWIGWRILILEDKEGSGFEKTFKEKAETFALRNSLRDDLRELGDASLGVTCG